MIHIYTLHNINICLDVNSGVIHVLDDISKDLLQLAPTKIDLPQAAIALKERYDEKEIAQAMDEINELIDNQTLYSDDFDETLFTNKHIEKISVKAICLHMAHDCNLRCKYCFAEKGSYGGDRCLMPFEVAKKAIDYLLTNSGSKKNVEVDFFGGEPLLNFEVVKQTVAYTEKEQVKYNKEVHFTITTNGTILNEEIETFIDEHINNIVLSLDGRKSVNDQVRVYPSGAGSYDKIVDNIKKIALNRNGKQYFVRGTYTKNNLDFYQDVLHMYKDLGLKEISIEPVSGGEFELNEKEIGLAMEEYERFALEYAKQNDYSFYHFNISIYHSPCIFKRISSCGAGTEYFAVSPQGDYYACHQFVGEEQFKMGDVDHGITNLELANKFANTNVFEKEDCRDCFAKYFCSGGCHANAYYTNGDIKKPNKGACKLQKKRIECAMYIEAKRALDRSENEE